MKYLIIPDVHGRTFWEKPVKETLENTNDHIIFLGDYLDPYPDEFEYVDFQKRAFDMFQQIIELKKENPDRITLLLGNHDLEYAVSTRICDCRRDRQRYVEIQKLFRDNYKLFQLAVDTTVNEKRYIFSHAGIPWEWARYVNDANITKDNIVDVINNEYEQMMKFDYPEESSFSHLLGECSYYRGGWNPVSSMVWADIREWVYEDLEDYAFQICGHTRCSKPIVTEKFAMLDAQAPFYLNEDGVITNILNNPIQLTDTEE